MAYGIDIQISNARGHQPLELCTDSDVKLLINKSIRTKKCPTC